MSYKKSVALEGYFEYVVPPLEGLWWAVGDFDLKKGTNGTGHQ